MIFRKSKKKHINHDQHSEKQQDLLSMDLAENLQILSSSYKDCSDVIFRPFLIGGQLKAQLIYIEGLSNIQEIDANVLSPLMRETEVEESYLRKWTKEKVSVSRVKEVKTFTECIEHISIGNPVILVERENQGVALGLAQWEKRSVEEPTSESVVKGPREGFTETLGVNTALIRRRLRSSKLKMKSMKIGRYTQTEIIIAYIEGIADQTLIEEVENRLQKIEVDGILDSGYIEEMIEDNPYSPFPQIMSTERPDTSAASLLEGRVVILVDGSPFGLIAPTTLYSLLQSSEDYYQRFMLSTAIRWLRYLFVVFSLLLPSVYVAVLSYHQEMVPTKLILSMAASREAVPFPALVEALIMEVIFEALREAGIRLPKQIGAAVSIVGALVIGQAAIQAGIVSAPMVMVVALTGIASFTIPRYNFGASIRLLRFPMIFLAGALGILGVMLGLLIILTHLCTLRSFGVPYLSPLAPMKGKDMKDVLIRAPWWMLNTRPHLTGEYNQYRQAPNQKPGSKHGGEKND
ncbi:spore germination protein [Bacillus taeanensis]|uniref:Spore germination protein n=1 Tax=Bacillus taeanensis TaxID=273032 RepID=A0A366Y0Z9_9BACI|nr:spore germination protein [Bacillus taeanensis]RBW70094.1 spore germination protein [Bacillus taeanensis]